MLEVCLQYIRAAGREACGTIGKVESPHAAETLVEAQSGDLVGDAIEAAKPRLERMCIVQSETIELGDLEPGAAALLRDTLRGQQHAAWEDVGLDEVGTVAVALEEIVGDHDCLHDRRTAGRDVALQRAEIFRPVALPHRLDHLDRHDMVITALDVAIVAELEVDAIGKAR